MSRKLPLVLLLTLAMVLQGCGGIQPSSTSSDPAPTESEAPGAKDTSLRKTGKTYYVLTNQHITGNAKTISVMLYNGDKVQGKLIG